MSEQIRRRDAGFPGRGERRGPAPIARWLSAIGRAETGRLLGIILLVAVVARLLFFFAVFEPLKDRYGWMNDDNYDEIAMNVLAGNGYVVHAGEEPNTVRTPLYVLFLMLHLTLMGKSRLALLLIQSLLQAGACVLLYRMAEQFFEERRVAFLAAIGLALYPQSMLYASQYMTESLYLLLIVILAGHLLRISRGDASGASVAGLGALLALLTLCRPVTQLLIVPAALIVWTALREGLRARMLRLGAMAATFVLVISPWTIRNYAASGEFIPISSRGGRFLYSNTIAQQTEEDAALESLAREGVTDVDRAESKWLELAAANIARHPERFLENTLRTTLDFWYRGHSRSISIVNGLINFPLLLLGIVGLWAARRRGKGILPLLILILYFNAVYGMLHAIARYAIPAIPIVIMFAAYALFGSGRGGDVAVEGGGQWN